MLHLATTLQVSPNPDLHDSNDVLTRFSYLASVDSVAGLDHILTLTSITPVEVKVPVSLTLTTCFICLR